MAEAAKRPSWLKRFGPWILGLAIVVVIATQVPLEQFRASLRSGPHLQLILVELAITMLVLCTDALSTWFGLIAVGVRWSLGRVTAVRGATYLLFLVNYALGQGGFGYYLYKGGQPALRATGITLFLMGTNLATLLVLTFGVWATGADHGLAPAMWWTLVAGVAAFAVYLVIIAVRVRFLAERQILAPLFDAGLRGHAIAMVGRLPHVIAVVLSYWVTMRVWGIDVPFSVAATLMPAVVLAAVLPIAPAGLGTTQAAMVFFFSAYADGATPDDRQANLLAFGIVHFVYGLIAAVLVGLVCFTWAKRRNLLGETPTPSA